MNINKLMKQAQEMQNKVQEMQEKLGDIEIEGVSGGGLVKVLVTGKGEAKKLDIDKSLLDPEDDDAAEILGDLVVAAFNDAKNKAESTMSDEMAKLTGGMGLPPGMKLPF
jgi:DNA-binding YbaB/EbfC family protein